VALTNACQLFDHSTENLHNLELTHGSLTELSKLLFIHQEQLPHHSLHAEMLHLILSAIEMLFRGTALALANAFHKIHHPHPNDNNANDGGILFVQTLFCLLDKFETPSNTKIAAIGGKLTPRNESGDDTTMAMRKENVQNIGRIISRRRAAGAVVNLVGEETAELMISYKGLVDTLALAATQDDNSDVQTRSTLALTKLATHIADLQKHTEPSNN
jgi:hypothetical protein